MNKEAPTASVGSDVVNLKTRSGLKKRPRMLVVSARGAAERVSLLKRVISRGLGALPSEGGLIRGHTIPPLETRGPVSAGQERQVPSTPGRGRGRPSPAARPFTPHSRGLRRAVRGAELPKGPLSGPGRARALPPRSGHAAALQAAGQRMRTAAAGIPHASLSQYCGRGTRACATPAAHTQENAADACALATAAHTALCARSQAFRAGVRLAHAQSFPPVVPRLGNGSSLRSNQRDSAARLCGLLLGSAAAVRLRGALTGLRPPVPRGRAGHSFPSPRPHCACAVVRGQAGGVPAHAQCAEKLPPHAQVPGRAVPPRTPAAGQPSDPRPGAFSPAVRTCLVW